LTEVSKTESSNSGGFNRPAPPSQNGANRAYRPRRGGYRGAYPHEPTGRWLAQTSRRGRVRRLSSFDRAAEAAKVYDRAAIVQWGPFAKTNAGKRGPGRRRDLPQTWSVIPPRAVV